MQQVQIQLGNMPIILVLLSDGGLVFVLTRQIKAIIDQGNEVEASFYADEFFFEDGTAEPEWLSYNTVYDFRQYPLMLKWLQQQNLPNPFQ